MYKLELAMAAFFPLLLLAGAAIGGETFDDSLRIAYAMAMLTMGLMSVRWGTPAGAAGALAFVVIILGFAGMCAGVLILEDERTQTVLYHLAAGTSVALATAVTAAAAVFSRMSRRWREVGDTGSRTLQPRPEGILEEGNGRDAGEALQSARVMTVAELRDFTRDLPQDTRILFPGAGAETNLTEGMDVQVRKITAGMDQELQEETRPDVPPTAPDSEKGRRVRVLLFG